MSAARGAALRRSAKFEERRRPFPADVFDVAAHFVTKLGIFKHDRPRPHPHPPPPPPPSPPPFALPIARMCAQPYADTPTERTCTDGLTAPLHARARTGAHAHTCTHVRTRARNARTKARARAHCCALTVCARALRLDPPG